MCILMLMHARMRAEESAALRSFLRLHDSGVFQVTLEKQEQLGAAKPHATSRDKRNTAAEVTLENRRRYY